VVGNGTELNYTVYNRPSWSEYSGNLYIDVPDSVLDPQITVIALQLDGPVRLYRSSGQVIESN
jgi:alpha-L-fucosidase